MRCHECLMSGSDGAAVAVCKFCFVGLCKPHLVQLFDTPQPSPQFGCWHRPEASSAR